MTLLLPILTDFRVWVVELQGKQKAGLCARLNLLRKHSFFIPEKTEKEALKRNPYLTNFQNL